MAPKEKQKIEIEKTHRDPFLSLNQAVTVDCSDFLGTALSIVRSWQTRLRRLFPLAGVMNGHAHRFPETFAVELLLAEIPIERVSILLGHQSTRVTEKHYSPWVRSRQEQLEAELERAWSRDPLVLVQARATRRLRGEQERVN